MQHTTPASLPRLHERLQRALDRHFGPGDSLPAGMSAFLREVDEAYRGADDAGAGAAEPDRGRMEEALRIGDAAFRELADTVGAPTFLYQGTRFRYVNAAAAELTGYTRDELLGMPFWEIVHPDWRETVRQRGLARQRGEKVPARYEFKVLRKDGVERWVDFTAGVVTYGGEACALGTCFDVTRHKRAEEALRRQALAFENLSDAVVITDLSGKITDWNPAAERMYGFTREEVLGKTIDLWLPGGRADELTPAILDALERDGRWEGEIRFTRSDGGAGVSETVVVPLFDGEGKRVGALGVNTDITGRKAAEERLRTSEERFRLMVGGSREVFFYVFDTQGVFEYLTPSVREVLGYEADELVGRPYHELRTGHLSDDEIQAHLARTLAMAGEANGYVVWARHRDGHAVPLEVVETAVRRGPRVGGIQGFARDITERIRAEEALRESEERYRTLFEESRDAVYMTTLDGRFISVNQAAVDLFGYTREELLARRVTDLYADATDRERFRDEIFRAGFVREYEVRLSGRNGAVLYCLVSATLRRSPEGEVLGFQGIIHDITERKVAEEQLAYGALHDTLTGLPNRALFVDRLERARERFRRGAGNAFAVLFLDLDRFKVVNDSLGHGVGDRMLMDIAARLEAHVPPGSTVGRFGGDEFTILLSPLHSPLEATQVAERLLEALSEPFPLGTHEIFATASIGVALPATGREAPDELLRNADAALSRAKALGKNRYEVFDRGMHAAAMERLRMESDLRRALERGEFALLFQPIISLVSGRVAGMEALLRWRHPERGTVSPDAFIPLAEETGLILPLGRWVIEEACRRMSQWQERFPGKLGFTVSVNLSARQFEQADLVEHLARSLEECGVEPARFKLEITESVLLEHADAWSTLERLRELGVMLVMDDFGTGYSSLSYLHRFPLDELKIDRSFVTRMHEDSRSAQLVYAVVALARNLGVQVVAEGVETREHLAALRRLGCDYGQGYLFAEPLDPDASDALIARDPEW